MMQWIKPNNKVTGLAIGEKQQATTNQDVLESRDPLLQPMLQQLIPHQLHGTSPTRGQKPTQVEVSLSEHLHRIMLLG